MCTLKIYSNVSTFESFAKTTALPVSGVQVKGKRRWRSGEELFSRNRVSLLVSGKEWDDFPGQALDAIQFLIGAEAELTELISTHHVDSAYLDFPLYSRLDGNIINQNDHLPRELVALAGRIGLGIEMAIYEQTAFDEIASAADQAIVLHGSDRLR